MAPGREDLHDLRGHVGDPAPGHLPGAAGDVATAQGAGDPRADQRREERRERLAEAALELFSTRGFIHTSVDDVVGVARTSKTAFYEAWSSREDCLGWMLDRLGDRLVVDVQSGAALGADPVDRLRRGLAGFVEVCTSDRRLARLLLVESVGVSGPVEEARRRIQDRFAAMVEVEVRGSRAERHRGVDPWLFGRAVVGATQEATAELIALDGEVMSEVDIGPVIRGLWAIFAPAAPARTA